MKRTVLYKFFKKIDLRTLHVPSGKTVTGNTTFVLFWLKCSPDLHLICKHSRGISISVTYRELFSAYGHILYNY